MRSAMRWARPDFCTNPSSSPGSRRCWTNSGRSYHPVRRWCTWPAKVEMTSDPTLLCRTRQATDGVRPPASGLAPPRPWPPRSAGQQSRELAAVVRSAPCNDPLSFLLGIVGRNLSWPARPGGLVPQSSPDGDHAVSAHPGRCSGPPSSAAGSPPRSHRRARRLSGRWARHHTRHPPSPGQSGHQFDRAAGLPGTDQPHPDPSASAPRSCRWRHPPPDAACAMSGVTSRHASPPATGPPRRLAGRCCRSRRATDQAARVLAGSPATPRRDD